MDDWLLHKDIIDRVADYYGPHKCLLTVYGRVESVVEREFRIILPLKKRLLKFCLDDPEFSNEIRDSDLPMTLDTPDGRNFSRRIYNRYSYFPGFEHSRRGFFLPETNEEISTRSEVFSEGIKTVELKLRKELVLEDLKKIERGGVFCFESFRFSERTIEELGECERSEIFRGEHFIYKKTFRNNNSLRLRMKSFSVITGKVMVMDDR